jgi:hypothetical protein
MTETGLGVNGAKDKMTRSEEARLRAELATELGFWPAATGFGLPPPTCTKSSGHRRQSAEADANHQAYERESGHPLHRRVGDHSRALRERSGSSGRQDPGGYTCPTQYGQP